MIRITSANWYDLKTRALRRDHSIRSNEDRRPRTYDHTSQLHRRPRRGGGRLRCFLPTPGASSRVAAYFPYKQQDELLERAIELAKAFNTPYVRIFDFWRLEDPTPYRKAIDDRVREAAIKAGKKGVTLTLENELSCNTATGAEAARL